MFDSVKVKNTSGGPLAIMRTWDAPVESTRWQSTWKRAEGGMKRTVRKVVHTVPSAFHLADGEEVTLPRAAANSDQIVGLHAAGRIKVTPVTTPAKLPVPAPTPASSSDEGDEVPKATESTGSRRGRGGR